MIKNSSLRLFIIVTAVNLALCAVANSEDYYDKLASDCQNKQSKACCLASVKAMKAGNYQLVPQEGCPAGYQPNGMRCIASYGWCQPTTVSPAQKPSGTEIIYPTQEECRQKTGKSCGFQACDYAPKGKIFEEVCGKNFKKGWAPSQTQNTAFDLSFSTGGSIFGSSFEVNISGVNIAYRETIHEGTDEVKKIERTLSPDELEDIRKTILETNLLNLQSESWDFSKPPIVTDQASYGVSLSIDGKKNSISCYITPAEIAPPSECEKRLDKLRLKLNSILGVGIY